MEDFKLKYDRLATMVTNMVATQNAYFRPPAKKRDPVLLRSWKQQEARVLEFINPEKSRQQAFSNWLAQ